ncbi:MAG TPA: BMP family ABC transporter substrate-binding protein [Candidatus Sulfotelmatobacter sp.]|jgi:simple sugar transport system substrate-binding protein|nr:BMP family ABC transporter substrate-binding protein [Candidatus Sulfotelmatobacter sp.]
MNFAKWALALAMLAGTAGAAQADPLKAAWVYVGPVSDHGYSFQHDQGRKAAEAAFGDKLQTTFVESVPEGADAERVINQLVKDGNKLIFSTSFGFMNATLKVAQKNPDVKFEHATGYKRADNMSTYSARFYEARTVLGTIAGKMTKSGVVGYVASIPIPEVVSGINAFTIALRKVRPDAVVKVIYVNSWYDPGKEAAAAKTLIDQGADVIAQHTDSPAPVQTAEERGVWSFGQSSDMSRFGPKHHLTGVIENWNEYTVQEVKAVMDGTWKSHDTWGGLASGMVQLAPFNPAMPKDVADAANKVREDIIAGRLNSFAGPIKDQDGKEVAAAGKTLSDADILGMKYYVEGVQGSLPK